MTHLLPDRILSFGNQCGAFRIFQGQIVNIPFSLDGAGGSGCKQAHSVSFSKAVFVTLVLAFSILIENVIGVVPSSISASDSSSIRFTQAVFPKDMQQNKEAAKTPLARISFSLYYYCGATVFPLSQLYSMNLVLKMWI